MKKVVKDLSASVRQRLLNHAKETNRPFDELIQYYAMERFLYRLSQSDYSAELILKGALMFIAWDTGQSRATRDIDLLGHLKNTVENVVGMIKEICVLSVEHDGMRFDSASVKGRRIKEDADYEGVRVQFTGYLGRTQAAMQVDIGFGDTVYPKPSLIEYPSALGMPRPKLWGYPRETVVAEKFEAMVNLGLLNSRMKDFYDIYLLANQFDFNGGTLEKAIRQTFAHRGTTLTTSPFAFSDEFTKNPAKGAQWKAFLRKCNLSSAPKDLVDAINGLKVFLLPVVEGKTTNQLWKAPGPWAFQP